MNFQHVGNIEWRKNLEKTSQIDKYDDDESPIAAAIWYFFWHMDLFNIIFYNTWDMRN